MQMMFEIGACSYTQNHVFDTKPIILKSCATIEKFEAQTSEAIIYADFKNAIYLFLTTTGWT